MSGPAAAGPRYHLDGPLPTARSPMEAMMVLAGLTSVCTVAVLVMVVEPLLAQSPAPRPAQARGAVPAPSPGLQGATVVRQVGAGTVPLVQETARVRVIDARADTLRGLVGVFPADEAPPAATGATEASFVWIIPGRTSGRPVDERRPVFLVTFRDLPNLNANDLVPAIVRLPPTLSGVRLLASIRARADQPARTQADWNIARDLRQEIVGTAIDVFEPGSVRLQPSSSLDRGEYAVVLRLRGGRNVSGSVLSPEGEGGVMAAAWTFSVD